MSTWEIYESYCLFRERFRCPSQERSTAWDIGVVVDGQG
jgi:hypothetical protein